MVKSSKQLLNIIFNRKANTMQTQTTAPLAPYGSLNHLALVAKVGGGKDPSTITPATRTVVRRAAAQ
jgi:hypothetical protein